MKWETVCLPKDKSPNLTLHCLPNKNGIYSITMENYGQRFWIQNMEGGGVLMQQQATITHPYGGQI